MRTLILSTAMLVGLGAAAPAMAQGVYIGGPGGADRGDCRMVDKQVVRGNKKVITKERRCDGDRRVYREDRRDRYVERRDNGPGIYIGPR